MTRTRVRERLVSRKRKARAGARALGEPPCTDLPLWAAQEMARHRATLSALLDPVITIDARGVVLTATPAVQRVFGWRPTELVGHSVGILMPEPHASAHGDYVGRHVRTGRTDVLGRPRQFEALRRDGRLIPVEISISRTRVPGEREPLFVGIIRDISEQRRLETSLRQSEHRMRLAMQVAAAGVWDWDLQTGAVWWSPEMYELLGVPTHKGMCRACSLACVHADDRERVSNSIDEAVSRQEDFECEFRIVHPSKGVRWMASHGRVDRTVVGGARRLLGFTIDITDRKNAEMELERHRKNLQQLVAQRTAELHRSQEQVRVQDRMATIGTLAAGLGHDMNNVLLPVRAHLNAAIAADGALAHGAVLRGLGEILKGVDYLQHLADGLHYLTLDSEHSDGGRTPLAGWWKQTGALLCKGVPKHVRVVSNLASAHARALPALAIAPHRLTQAVLNLIVNGGQAIPPPSRARRKQGVVRVDAELGPSLPGKARQVRLHVRDNGIGMTDEVKQRAFEMFFTTKPRGLGTGLGLPLVARVIRNAGGTVTIDSTPGVGTTITLGIPSLGESNKDAMPPRTATISVRHRRIASVLHQLLNAAGVDTHDACKPDSSPLWIVESGEARLREARRWLAEGSASGERRVLVVGAADDNSLSTRWEELNAIVVQRPDDFTELRGGVSRALSCG